MKCPISFTVFFLTGITLSAQDPGGEMVQKLSLLDSATSERIIVGEPLPNTEILKPYLNLSKEVYGSASNPLDSSTFSREQVIKTEGIWKAHEFKSPDISSLKNAKSTKLVQSSKEKLLKEFSSHKKLLKEIPFDFKNANSEAKRLYQFYKKVEKKDLKSTLFSNSLVGNDSLKSIGGIFKHIERGAVDEIPTKKDFLGEYTHLAKFAEKYSTVSGNELIKQVIKDRDQELSILQRKLKVSDLADHKYTAFDYKQAANLSVRDLLQHDQFQLLSSTQKNKVLQSVDHLSTIDADQLEHVLKEPGYEDLKTWLNSKQVINDSVIAMLETINVSEIESKIQQFDEKEELQQRLSDLIDTDYWPDSTLATLPMLNSQVLKTELLKELEKAGDDHMDSLKQYQSILEKLKANQKKAKKQIEQAQETEVVEEMRLRAEDQTKGFLPQNTYIDFIVGYAQGEHSVLNLAPNFGINLTSNFSAGLGVTFQHTFDKHAPVSSLLGYKVFGKFEFLQKRLFLTAENVFLFPGLSYIHSEGRTETLEFTTLIGGGYALEVLKAKVLTISMHYNFNDKMPAPALSSPWLMRLGIDIF
jgi:hypothetical protein